MTIPLRHYYAKTKCILSFRDNRSTLPIVYEFGDVLWYEQDLITQAEHLRSRLLVEFVWLTIWYEKKIVLNCFCFFKWVIILIVMQTSWRYNKKYPVSSEGQYFMSICVIVWCNSFPPQLTRTMFFYLKRYTIKSIASNPFFSI